MAPSTIRTLRLFVAGIPLIALGFSPGTLLTNLDVLPRLFQYLPPALVFALMGFTAVAWVFGAAATLRYLFTSVPAGKTTIKVLSSWVAVMLMAIALPGGLLLLKTAAALPALLVVVLIIVVILLAVVVGMIGYRLTESLLRNE